jgi:hypothetical protein
MTLYFANHRRHPNLFTKQFPSIKAEAAMVTAAEIKQIHKQAQENLKTAQKKTVSYINKKRKMAPQLKEGDKVYLLTKNLRTRRPTKKLDHVKVRPFFIQAQKGLVNYLLDLLKDAKVHPVFHISLLEPADPRTPIQQEFHYQVEEDNEFKVKKIKQHQRTTNGTEYLVKWKGYPQLENT